MTTELREALTTGLSTLLHEEADPECTGEPSYFVTQERAELLADQLISQPLMQNTIVALRHHPDPAIGVQEFASNLEVFEPGTYRFVRFEPCPLGRNRRHCKDEHHHWGRGDHVVPMDPDWSPR